jgi:SAM-dependent methyltransferase
MKKMIREILPSSFLTAYRNSRALLQRWRYRGEKHYCNSCDSHLRSWIHVGHIDHINRVCPVCYSFGRQRFLAMVLTRELSSIPPTSRKTLLHFAPELGLQRWLKERMYFLTYISADLSSPEVDINLDIQHINLPDNAIDFVLLSHVLEHVPDDILAIQEIYRILAPGGKLFVQVPLSGENLTQDDNIDTPEMRLARYGKTDHVRLYGEDILTRLVNAGFRVTIYRANDDSFKSDFNYMALDIPSESTMLYASESSTYVCQKKQAIPCANY